jgi:hypothetical protein
MQNLASSVDTLDPFLLLLGPSGRVIATDDNGQDEGSGENLNSLIVFLSTQSGPYTIFASGGTGAYRIVLDRPACPTPAIPLSPGTVTKVVPQPSLRIADCHTPLISAGVDFFFPETNANADLYKVSLQAGDVFTVSAVSSESNEVPLDPHLWLLDPNGTILAENDDEDEIGITVPSTGTYTVVAGANFLSDTHSFDPFTPDPQPLYDVFAQRCPATNLTVGGTIEGTFTEADCQAFAGVKTRSYRIDAGAPQFLTASVTGQVFSGRLALVDSAGLRIENTTDAFAIADARISRMLPTGTHFLEVSGVASDGPQPLPAEFSLITQTCAPHELSAGLNAAEFTDDDCMLEDGTPYDVFTIAAAANMAASLELPDDGCSLLALSHGAPVPAESFCLNGYAALPLATTGTTAVMVGANAIEQRGAYQLTYRSCPLTLATDLGVNGVIDNADCLDAVNARSDFYFFRAPADLVRGNEGVNLRVAAGFSATVDVLDNTGAFGAIGPTFTLNEPATDMLSYPNVPPCVSGAGNSPCLGFLVQISGDGGAYQAALDALAVNTYPF